MTKEPKSKHCKVCQTLIPLIEWPDHKAMHDNQLDLFPDLPKIEPEPRKRNRKKERIA